MSRAIQSNTTTYAAGWRLAIEHGTGEQPETLEALIHGKWLQQANPFETEHAAGYIDGLTELRRTIEPSS